MKNMLSAAVLHLFVATFLCFIKIILHFFVVIYGPFASHCSDLLPLEVTLHLFSLLNSSVCFHFLFVVIL